MPTQRARAVPVAPPRYIRTVALPVLLAPAVAPVVPSGVSAVAASVVLSPPDKAPFPLAADPVLSGRDLGNLQAFEGEASRPAAEA